LQDHYHRTINYLRLSVTDRCNLRCIYCMPEKGIRFVPHREILTYEEMLHLVRLCVRQGIRKVRVTGGEPLVRKGIVGFLHRLGEIAGLEEITLTTNGVLLKDVAWDLRHSRLCRVNVSMDTLRPDRFARITRRDAFARVWEGIAAAEAAGLTPIKINVVAMQGVNDDEVQDFVRLTRRKPYHVRFIELMPGAIGHSWEHRTFLSSDAILERIRPLGPLRRLNSRPLDGPSQRYALKSAQGEIGLIAALSHHFCATCNRLRLTADGHLRGCLFSEQETDLKTPLRQGAADDALTALIQDTILNKPRDHGLSPHRRRKCVRGMNGIGG
jgi:GTP 3',8-cyclase